MEFYTPFNPKGSFVVQVFGENATKVTLYGIDVNGKLQEIQTFSCKDGSIINFDFKYTRLDTKYFEICLYDNKEKVIARDKRE